MTGVLLNQLINLFTCLEVINERMGRVPSAKDKENRLKEVEAELRIATLSAFQPSMMTQRTEKKVWTTYVKTQIRHSSLFNNLAWCVCSNLVNMLEFKF